MVSRPVGLPPYVFSFPASSTTGSSPNRAFCSRSSVISGAAVEGRYDFRLQTRSRPVVSPAEAALLDASASPILGTSRAMAERPSDHVAVDLELTPQQIGPLRASERPGILAL